MIRKILVGASLAGFLLAGTPGLIHARQGQQNPQNPPPQSQQETKSVTGKVTDIGDQGHSFTVSSSDGQTLKFMVDKNTQVKGQVKVGTMVAVDYTPASDGQLVCVRVAAQQG